MLKVTITPLARKDPKDIGRYSQEKWGTKQRNVYLDTLNEGINQLTKSQKLDRKRDEIKAGLLSCSCRKHMIFLDEMMMVMSKY